MNDKKKLIALPIELYQREFHLSIYMAIIAAKQGYQVIIGEQNQKIFKKVRSGIYFHKDHANWSYNLYKDAKSRKMRTAAFDVEGLIYKNEDYYINNRVSTAVIKLLDVVFTWGDNQKRIIQTVIGDSDKICVVGSPKMDICNLVAGTSESKVNHNNVMVSKVLVNTRFSYINGLRGKLETANLINLGVLKTAADIQIHNTFMISEQKIFDEFEKLIRIISENNCIQLTIRPHPAENERYYAFFASQYPNIIVDNKTELNKQILQHDCVIHDGCTTAIEARAIGKPVFGLRPRNLSNAYVGYANKYSRNFYDAETLAQFLLSVPLSEYQMPDCDNIASMAIKNWKRKDVNATLEMVRYFDGLDIIEQKIVKASKVKYFDVKHFIYRRCKGSGVFSFFCKNILGKRYDRFIRSRETIDKKFSDLDFENVRMNIKNLNDLDPRNTSQLDTLDIIPISRKSFIIYKR